MSETGTQFWWRPQIRSQNVDKQESFWSCKSNRFIKRTLLFKVSAGHDEAGVTTVRKLVGFRQQILWLFAVKEHIGTALCHGKHQ